MSLPSDQFWKVHCRNAYKYSIYFGGFFYFINSGPADGAVLLYTYETVYCIPVKHKYTINKILLVANMVK